MDLVHRSTSKTSCIYAIDLRSTILRQTEVYYGAQVLGTFDNGRVESWIHMRALQPEEMCQADMAACIARRLAHFHNADITEDKEPRLFEKMLDW